MTPPIDLKRLRRIRKLAKALTEEIEQAQPHQMDDPVSRWLIERLLHVAPALKRAVRDADWTLEERGVPPQDPKPPVRALSAEIIDFSQWRKVG